MLDVAIIGGGLCGLALAHSLQARRIDWALFEARPRLGGRVLTVQSAGSASQAGGLPLDLGPTWFWPSTQPQISRLIQDLGLATLAQPDDGRVLLLDDPNRAPQPRAIDPATGRLAAEGAAPAAVPGAVHGGAHRLAGGMAALTDALAARLPDQRVHRARVLQAVIDQGSHVELRLLHGGQPQLVRARRVVLALPPRLAAAALRFEPPLPDDLLATMQATPTWMACAAKVATTCARPVWRDAGLAGNAWVTHPQAVLAEVFDAGPPATEATPARLGITGSGAALAGFVALGAAQRPAFKRGLSMLIDSQISMLFGADAGGGEQHLQDWADEAYTCTDADKLEDARPGAHPAYGDEALQQPLWQGRLWLGGSETARQGGGYLEGALSAAARLRRQLSDAANDAANDVAPATGIDAARAAARPGSSAPGQTSTVQPGSQNNNQPAIAQATAQPALQVQAPANNQPNNQTNNQDDNPQSLASFAHWVRLQREAALQRYRDRVHQALSQQQDGQLTQRAVLGALESLYDDALRQLDSLAWSAEAGTAIAAASADSGHAAVQQDAQHPGRHPLVPGVLAPFSGLADELLAEAVRFNATSCALSNFPFEHRPGRDYINTIRRDLAAAWADFARRANQLLQRRAGSATGQPA